MGSRPDLCVDLVRVCLRRLCHRRLRAADPELAGRGDDGQADTDDEDGQADTITDADADASTTTDDGHCRTTRADRHCHASATTSTNEVSTAGRVRSLERTVRRSDGRTHRVRERIFAVKAYELISGTQLNYKYVIRLPSSGQRVVRVMSRFYRRSPLRSGV